MARPPKAYEPLRQAALELFVDQGIHAAGIREIAKHAGVSEAAPYRYWASKDELILALFREHLAEVVLLLEQAIASAPDIIGQVRAATRATFALYDAQPYVFRFVLLVQHDLAMKIPADTRMPQDVVVAMVRAGRARGEAHGDPELRAAAMVGLFLQVAAGVVYGRLPGPLSRYTDEVADLAMGALRA